MGTQYDFDRLMPRLASQRRVVALDMPGCGDSDRPALTRAQGYAIDWLSEALEQVVTWLGVGPIDLLGHDFGGTVALHWAVTQHRVRRLTLVAPTLLAGSLPLPGRLGLVPALGPEVFRRAVRRIDLQRYLELCTSSPELLSQSEVDVKWDRLARRGGPEATHALLSQLAAQVRLRPLFGRLSVPTSLVWGELDEIVPVSHGIRLAELLRCEIHTLPGCGHNPLRERPEAVARVVEGALDLTD